MQSSWPRFIFSTAVLLNEKVVTILPKKRESLLWKKSDTLSDRYDIFPKADDSSICRENGAHIFSV